MASTERWDAIVVGAGLGGLTAGAVLGRDLAREVQAGLVLGERSRLTGGGPGWDPLLASKRLAKKPRRAAHERAAA